jgi:hypothetical protein
VEGLLDRRCGRWGRQGCFVECTTRSDERVRTASYSSVSWAVHSLRTSFPACLSIPGVSVVVCVLDVAVVVVSEVVVAGVAAVVGGDVAVATGGSGCVTRGWGASWGVVSRPGSVFRRF